MKILAQTTPGSEFIYNAKTAHKIPEKHAAKICSIVNEYAYKLPTGKTWHVYDVAEYEQAAYYARLARFTYGKNGLVKELTYNY